MVFSQSTESEYLSPSQSPQKCSLMVPMPSFILSDIKLSILRCEIVFDLYGIESQANRFDLLASTLPDILAQDLQDLIANPPLCNPYDALREALMDLHLASERKRLDKLLSGLDLADHTPSQLFYRIQELMEHSKSYITLVREA